MKGRVRTVLIPTAAGLIGLVAAAPAPAAWHAFLGERMPEFRKLFDQLTS